VGVGALFDGNLRRVQTIKEMIDAGSPATTLIFLTGPRKTTEAEGASSRYKLVDKNGSEKPIKDLYPTEYDQVKAIFEYVFTDIKKTVVLRDESELAEFRGGEMCTSYIVRYDNKTFDVTIMNGMPVIQPDAVNRPKQVVNPRAPLTFQEYINEFSVGESVMSYVSSYPHRNRIAIEGLMAVIDMGLGDKISIHPNGKMSWPDKVTGGLHAGEVEPMMRLTRQLLGKAGISQSIIPSTYESLRKYIATHPEL
jgi:hypothetical protein